MATIAAADWLVEWLIVVVGDFFYKTVSSKRKITFVQYKNLHIDFVDNF